MSYFFFFNDTATTEIYTLSLHDALPISILSPPYHLGGTTMRLTAEQMRSLPCFFSQIPDPRRTQGRRHRLDRKSTRLNSSHGYISYAVFCLKKKIWQSDPRRSRF